PPQRSRRAVRLCLRQDQARARGAWSQHEPRGQGHVLSYGHEEPRPLRPVPRPQLRERAASRPYADRRGVACVPGDDGGDRRDRDPPGWPRPQGDSSSSPRPFVSIAKVSVTSPPASATAANAAKTYWMPRSATMDPTRNGPIDDPALSHALPKPVPI